MRIKRDDLEKWLDAENLNTVIKGGVIKISQGEEGKPYYKIMRVVGIKLLDSYQLTRERHTNIWIKMYESDPKNARSFKMKTISNQDITSDEFDEWRQMQDDPSNLQIARHEIISVTKNISEMRKKFNSLSMIRYQAEKSLFD